jgi:hypothetical protein
MCIQHHRRLTLYISVLAGQTLNWCKHTVQNQSRFRNLYRCCHFFFFYQDQVLFRIVLLSLCSFDIRLKAQRYKLRNRDWFCTVCLHQLNVWPARTEIYRVKFVLHTVNNYIGYCILRQCYSWLLYHTLKMKTATCGFFKRMYIWHVNVSLWIEMWIHSTYI